MHAHLGALRSLTAAAAAATDPDAIVAAVLDGLAALADRPLAAAHLAGAGGLAPAGVRGGPASALASPETRVALARAAGGERLRPAPSPARDERARSAPSPAGGAPSVPGSGPWTWAHEPIRDGDDVLGVLTLACASGVLSDADLAVLEAAAAVAGLALGGARRRAALARGAARVLAEGKLAAVGRLVPGVSHDINNPLTAVLGQTHLLLARQDLPSALRERLQTVADQAGRVARIVQALLAFSRRHPPERRPCALADQVQRVLDLIAHQLYQDGVRVVSELGTAPVIHADENAIQHAVLALVQRAHQAVVDGGGERVIAVRVSGDGTTARAEISDTGPPLAPAEAAAIEDPLSGDDGPGLALAGHIIAAHGGRLRVARRPEGGVTVTVELPAGGAAR